MLELETIITPQNINMLIHICAAILAGGAIGFERSYHGRPAGFRTHTLVCLASSSLMMVTVYYSTVQMNVSDAIHIDPTRMAQGIMTGIGFLGAGVIYKEGISVRGLTTAASIWITAAIGILMGVGLFFPGIFATLMTLGVLSYFQKIERAMPKRSYVHCRIQFDRQVPITEVELNKMMHGLEFNVGNLSYHAVDQGRLMEYHMVLRTRHADNVGKLAVHLSTMRNVLDFHIAPSGD